MTRDSELGQGGQNALLELNEVEAFAQQWGAVTWNIRMKIDLSIISQGELKLPLWGEVHLNLLCIN